MIYITKDMINKAKILGYAYPEILEKNKRDPLYLLIYAKNIVGGRCPMCEKKLLESKDIKLIYLYVVDIIKGRWKEAEDVILNSNNIKYLYLYTFNFHPKWREAEKKLLEKCDIRLLWLYNKYIKRYKWRKVERILFKKESRVLSDEEVFNMFNISVLKDKNKKWKVTTFDGALESINVK